jgi:acyl dehydratase
MRRRAWLGLVAAGWFVFAIAMGLTTDRIRLYVLFCGLGIWICMALPGWLMTRAARKAA